MQSRMYHDQPTVSHNIGRVRAQSPCEVTTREITLAAGEDRPNNNDRNDNMFKSAIAITIAALVAVILTGCATPIVTMERVDGIDYIQHIDDLDTWPDGCSKVGGCHQIVDGIPHIWIAGISPGYIVAHERAHVAGMRHTDWTWNGRESCTVITAGGGKYRRGQRICIDASGEHQGDNIK